MGEWFVRFGLCSFVRSFVCSFVRFGSFVRSFVRSLVRSLWFVGSLVRWFVGSLVCSFVRSFVGSLVRLFVRWFAIVRCFELLQQLADFQLVRTLHGLIVVCLHFASVTRSSVVSALVRCQTRTL